ncbi:MAG: protein of unknown function DUF3108 [Idiomarinaceae bacterium HL-53]|nr:MAG: protein of unknown function DUF3108 [Idiomarinaceae bacterium HL-53]CUS48718.1 Protein of unknown function (DUF3108) [Idiomarinaceae bacterium HL-53]
MKRKKIKMSHKRAIVGTLLCALSMFSGALIADDSGVNSDIQAQRINQPYEAQYVVTRRGREHGEALRRLQAEENNTFSYFTVTDVSFLFLSDTREQVTAFRFERGQVQPISYQYKRTGTGEDEARNYRFEAEAEQLTNGNGDRIDVEWSEALLDVNSVLHQLQFDLSSGATEFSYRVLDEHGREDTYTFEIEGDETLTLPYGTVDTVRVKRIRESNRRETFIWFSPLLNYSIVQMQQLKEGKEQAKLSLRSLRYAS